MHKRPRNGSESPTQEAAYKKYKPIEDERTLYLETVDRSRLDFDFEKLCAKSMTNINVYACLVCGSYYQGRGSSSPCYFHSMTEDHHVFLNLTSLKTYILPEGYQVTDPSLNDILYVVNPTFTAKEREELFAKPIKSFDLQGKQYLPGKPILM